MANIGGVQTKDEIEAEIREKLNEILCRTKPQFSQDISDKSIEESSQ